MKKYFYIILFFSISIQAQNLDSLYNILISSRGSTKYQIVPSEVGNKQPDKCGFGLAATIKEHLHEFSIEQQQNIEKVMDRPILGASIVSPSGIFRIHFDESGNNKPLYDITDLAVAFDSAYNFEVNILGYPAPPLDGDIGGDNKYDIYVRNLNGGLYGATTPETSEGDGTYQSYIEIDNSFDTNEGYNSFGINGVKVTAAHEFHHAIQLGNYGFFSDDIYYHELTSTAFEEFVYDEVNDYYAYMWSFFRNTNKRLQDNSGYNLAVWNIFLKESLEKENPMLGHEIVKRSWELMHDENSPAIIAVAKAMKEFGYAFLQKFNEFGDWLYFTNVKAKQGKFFEEAANYPSIKSSYTFELTNSEKTLTLQCEPTSINYLTYTDYTQGFADTIVAVLSNSDVDGSIASGNAQSVEFTISKNLFNGSEPISDNYFSKLNANKINLIQDSYIVNNELASIYEGRFDVDYVYPQPFKYGINSSLFIPTFGDISGKAELYVYSTDMNLVYSATKLIPNAGEINIEWNGKDEHSNKLASGVYVYVTRANGKIKKGKFVILN